jgi:hypothetical protein
MKQKLFTILIMIMISLSSSLYSQTFTFHRISPAIVNGDTSTFGVTATKGVFKNTGSDTLSFIFVRFLNSLPSSNWTTSLCVGTNCFSSTLDTVPPRGATPVKIGPGRQDTLTIDFNGTTIGTGTVIMKVWVNSNPQVFATDTFKVHLGPIGIRKISSVVEGYKLEQNYPNPFNPTTKINFSLQKNDNVSLKVYDILGNEAAKLINNEVMLQGKYSYEFNASEYNLPSGVFYYMLKTENFISTKKMMLIK